MRICVILGIWALSIVPLPFATALPFSQLQKAASWAPSVVEATKAYKKTQQRGARGLGYPWDFKISLEEGGLFVCPNEHQPVDSLPQLTHVPNGGAYLAVGTERGFVGAALLRSGALYLVDISKGAYVFNVINVWLLKTSENREAYVRNRLTGTIDHWKNLGGGWSHLTHDEQKALFDFWDFFVRGAEYIFLSDINGFFFLHAHPSTMIRPAFQNANYLYDESLFKHIKHLAEVGRIYPNLADVTSVEHVEQVVAKIKDNGHQVGVFDWSNLTSSLSAYGDAKGLREGALDHWLDVAHPQAHLLSTTLGDRWDTGFPHNTHLANRWLYTATPFSCAILELANQSTRPIRHCQTWRD